MASKKKKKECKKLLKMSWNEEIPVIEEDSKFFICKGQQFRKSNPEIMEVIEIAEPVLEEESEERSDE